MIDRMKHEVYLYAKDRLCPTDNLTFSEDDVYVVWSCHILGHKKALISTCLPDGMYYEVTYDSERRVMYIDAYKKFDQRVVNIE